MVVINWQHRYEPSINGTVRVAENDAKGVIQHIESRGPYKAQKA